MAACRRRGAGGVPCWATSTRSGVHATHQWETCAATFARTPRCSSKCHAQHCCHAANACRLCAAGLSGTRMTQVACSVRGGKSLLGIAHVHPESRDASPISHKHGWSRARVPSLRAAGCALTAGPAEEKADSSSSSRARASSQRGPLRPLRSGLGWPGCGGSPE